MFAAKTASLVAAMALASSLKFLGTLQIAAMANAPFLGRQAALARRTVAQVQSARQELEQETSSLRKRAGWNP